MRVAVNNRKKNAQSGQWEDVPMWIDAKAFNRGESGKTADLCEQYLKKGSQVYLEGHLELDEWADKTTGAKRSKHVLIVENVQFLDAKGQAHQPQGGATATATGPLPEESVPHGVGTEDIPFAWLIFAVGLSSFLGGLV